MSYNGEKAKSFNSMWNENIVVTVFWKIQSAMTTVNFR